MKSLTKGFLFIWLAGLVMTCAGAPKGKLVIVGGGATPAGLHRKILDLAGGTNASVVVIPFASSLADAGQSSVKAFVEAGATRVTLLSTNSAQAATAALQAARGIWFPGGDQSRLIRGLDQLGVLPLIRERFDQGAVIGGTSAGAAVMSRVMIAGNPKAPAAVPPLGQGIGLWPEAIVDQHFIKRQREPRLRAVVEAHPELLGVGIDESTYVIVSGGSFDVAGNSAVVLLDGRAGGPIQRRQLSAGETFAWAVGETKPSANKNAGAP